MNIYLYSNCFNYGICIYVFYILLTCLITENMTLSEFDDYVTSRHNHKNGHNYHHKLRKNSAKRQFKTEPVRTMGRNNMRDYISSRRAYNNSRFYWQSKLLSPLISSSLADYRSDVKVSRKNNASVKSRLKRPNIIFIITDDQDVELGSMKFMPKTLKILGEEGAHFPNSFVTTPMCCPSRSTMLTGLYVHNHNVYTNNDNCSSLYWQTTYETRTFAPYLANAGYRTAYFGKYLNEYNGTYIPPGWREWSALIRNSKFYNYTLNVNGNKIKHGDIYELDYYPDLIINDSLQFLQYSKRFFANKPLMMVLSFPSPHGPEDAAPKYQNLFLNVTTHRTPSWNYAPNDDKQWLLRRTGKMEKIHTDFTDLLHTKRLQTLQSIDDAMERLYNELIRIGELDNTYIFYTSDHGYHLGQFGLVKGKSMPFEFDVKVPFYVRGPKITPGITIDKIVLNIDLAPTFLDIGGVQIPSDMDGNSILPLLQSSFDNNYDSNQWRDTFLIERGKSTLETDNTVPALSKKQWLSLECQKPEYRSPCAAYQKFECFFDGNELRIRKCRKSYWNKVINKQYRKHKCICPKEQTTDHYIHDDVFDAKSINSDTFTKSKRKKLDSYEKKLQRRFLKEHIVNKDFRPVFIGALRSKRDVNLMSNENFDVNGVFLLNNLLDASMSKAVNNFNSTNVNINSRIGETSCVVLSNLSVSCSDEIYQNKYVWREKKNRLDSMIKKLQIKLVELKGIRHHLNQKRPLFETQNRDNTDCDCSSIDSYHRNTYVNHKRMRMYFRQRKREKKLRRKTKFENTTCNYEKTNKMKCFTHDNDHWKTPPLWTKGPFCFCQNSNNNSFWCLRTINSTHNFLYCEFVTGFITYYNLLEDPYQLKNSIYDLEFSTLEELRRQLNILKNCEGNRQCTHTNNNQQYHHSNTRNNFINS